MKKNNLKRALQYTPEILLLVGGVGCFMGELIGASYFNNATLLGILVVVSLLIWKNRYLALSAAVILGAASVYFLLALLSEFGEFPAGDKEGWRMLLIGGLIFGSLLAVAIVMPKKYFRRRALAS